MLPESRRLRIVDLIGQAGNGVVSIGDLSRELGVSEMTVRRDLDYLEEHSIVRRVHGGAIAFTGLAHEKPFVERIKMYDPQKQALGWAAAQLVQDGDRVILDAGTTTRQIARHLVTRSRLTIITNNIPVAQDLATCPQIDTILLGGVLKHRELCTVGEIARHDLSRFRANKLFLSAAGFSTQEGISDPDLAESEVKQAMIEAARDVILVADSNKYQASALVRVAPLKVLQAVVTDDFIPGQAIREIEEIGIRVYTPERMAAAMVRTSEG